MKSIENTPIRNSLFPKDSDQYQQQHLSKLASLKAQQHIEALKKELHMRDLIQYTNYSANVNNKINNSATDPPTTAWLPDLTKSQKNKTYKEVFYNSVCIYIIYIIHLIIL